MTNESADGTPPTPGALINERAVALATAARDFLRTEGGLVDSRGLLAGVRLRIDAFQLESCLTREHQAMISRDTELARNFRQKAINSLADTAGDALLALEYLLAHTCRGCGCTWIEPGLCSSCGPGADPDVDPLDDYDRTTHFQAAIAASTPEGA